MYNLKILKEEDGTFLLSDKANVLEHYYAYIKKFTTSSESDFYKNNIDNEGDLDEKTLHSWIKPKESCTNKLLSNSDSELLTSIMVHSRYISLVSNMNNLLNRFNTQNEKEKAIEEAQKVSECAKKIIIQEYLDSLDTKKLVA